MDDERMRDRTRMPHPNATWDEANMQWRVPEPATAGEALDQVASTSDARTVNNTMRYQYRVLTDAEKAQMQRVKDEGLAFHETIAGLGSSRELSIAKTKIEEAVMWAVKHTIVHAGLAQLAAR